MKNEHDYNLKFLEVFPVAPVIEIYLQRCAFPLKNN